MWDRLRHRCIQDAVGKDTTIVSIVYKYKDDSGYNSYHKIEFEKIIPTFAVTTGLLLSIMADSKNRDKVSDVMHVIVVIYVGQRHLQES